MRKMNQIEARRRHATSGLTIRGVKLFFKKVHTLRGWDRREARLRLFGNPKHITPKFASCATSITWRATRPWARQSGARSYAIVDICICRETGERGANPILSKRGKLRTPCGDSWIAKEIRLSFVWFELEIRVFLLFSLSHCCLSQCHCAPVVAPTARAAWQEL